MSLSKISFKEDVITFETAKLAKEKGFNIPCNKCYEYSLTEKEHSEDGKKGPFGWEKGELNLCNYFVMNNGTGDLSNENWYICAAPTQFLLQKWLEDL